jgi:nucleolar protein 16
MGRILQKRKNRSSAPKIKANTKKAKNGNKKINALSNAIVAKNWYISPLCAF